MQRDWSPTYYFRIMRAQELLALYRRDPDAFVALAQQFRSDFAPTGMARAPHRLSVWLKRGDLVFRTGDDIRIDTGKRLTKALDRPEYLGYLLRLNTEANIEWASQASPSAIGALSYIAFETRRLFED